MTSQIILKDGISKDYFKFTKFTHHKINSLTSNFLELTLELCLSSVVSETKKRIKLLYIETRQMYIITTIGKNKALQYQLLRTNDMATASV